MTARLIAGVVLLALGVVGMAVGDYRVDWALVWQLVAVAGFALVALAAAERLR